MPTYEYVCRACGHEFEEFQSIKADPVAVCPKCRKRKVSRKIGIGGAVLFKGGGFYETDYRSESYRSGADAEKKAGEAKAGEARSAVDASKGPNAKPAGDAEARSEAGSPTKPDASSTPAREAKDTAESSGSPDRSKASSSPASATASSDPARAENRRIESRATHPSRVGRGIGNIVAKGAKDGKPTQARTAARPSRPASRSKGRGRG